MRELSDSTGALINRIEWTRKSLEDLGDRLAATDEGSACANALTTLWTCAVDASCQQVNDEMPPEQCRAALLDAQDRCGDIAP